MAQDSPYNPLASLSDATLIYIGAIPYQATIFNRNQDQLLEFRTGFNETISR